MQTADYEHKQTKPFTLALITVQFREFMVGRHVVVCPFSTTRVLTLNYIRYLKAVFKLLFLITCVRLVFRIWCLFCLHFPGSSPVFGNLCLSLHIFNGGGFPVQTQHIVGEIQATGTISSTPFKETKITGKAAYYHYHSIYSPL